MACPNSFKSPKNGMEKQDEHVDTRYKRQARHRPSQMEIFVSGVNQILWESRLKLSPPKKPK